LRRSIQSLLLLAIPRVIVAQEDSSSHRSSDTTVEHYRNRLIALPFVSYAPQTKVMFGVAGGYQFKWPGMSGDSGTRASYLAASFAYTTKGQWSSFVETSLLTPHSRWWLFGRAAAGFFPLFYYGVGPHTEEADTNLMENRFIRLEGKVMRRVTGQLYLGPYYRLLSTFDVAWQFPSRIPTNLPGGNGGVSSALGFTLLVDQRNSITTPTQGHYFQMDYLRDARFLGSDFGYSHLAVDARTYLPVRRGRDVVALTVYGDFNGSRVPIQAMALLSNFTSQFVMRGVYLGRFRDRHELVAQVDYRGHLKGRFGYVVFGSSGNVFGSPGNDLFDDVKFTYGAGLRFNVNPRDPLNLRVDYTLTSFGSGGLSIGATEAF
jgi:hypothetical protein